MNLFYLDRDIIKCAEAHVDKHVVKMITEYNQLMSTTCHLLGFGSDEIYKLTHKNHPTAIWVRSSKEHFEYLLKLNRCLAAEYTYRYGKVHAGERLFPYFEQHKELMVSSGWTEPPQCMPEDCKQYDIVEAYRMYYVKWKQHIAKWKNRDVPDWFIY